MPFSQRVIPTRTDIPDVFQGNSQNVLQKASVSNMIGLLQQLNKMSIHASEIFSDILETTEANSQRVKKVKARLTNIEAQVQPMEDIFVANNPSYFYDNPYTGKEWQRQDTLRGLLFRRDRATKSINERRSVGTPLPDLSPLDRVSMNGECIKRYSDSNFFMNEWLEAEKKKLEEEKARRRERKKRRKKKKRQGQDKITGIERWVYDPITGEKVKKKAKEITVTQYVLSDTNSAANVTFESADGGDKQQMKAALNTSKVAMMANKKEQQQQIKKQQKAAPKRPSAVNNDATSAKAGPPPVPGGASAPGGGGGPGVPPPVPGANAGGPGAGPPPAPVGVNPASGPPPSPVVPKRPLSGAERAALSAQMASQSGAYAPPTVPQATAQAAGPPAPPKPTANALLAGIRGGVSLKKTAQVKREPKMEKRDMLLASLRGKGKQTLKKVIVEPKKEKVEEVDSTIFAILNRRQFMADDSESESGSDWSSED